ncbi:MAG: glycosyltransferase [Candidatus Abyssobacteria bacterium SURF_5]|uniref:Glycosyltransferase n=1 Tax=Abyssobacteria bacterium (strain SURF_5) TaxID=2093360 RepID=A0A3A4NP11_ABYX5|nr:MAG: glycosyltransferase [Candidatus Abyssubacteria bacterium SURF_5]
MIRIAHLFDTSGPGGAETVLVSLVRGLDPKRFDSVACIRENSWMHRQLEQKCVLSFLTVPRTYDVRFVAGLRKLIKQLHIDLVHSHEFFMNFYGTAAAAAAGIPSIATVHGQTPYAAEKLRRRLACRLVASRGCMVAVSNQVAARFHNEVGISRDRIRTIYNGIDIDVYGDNERLDDLRHELNLPAGTPLVGMVGNLYPVKGYPFFLEAMSLVKQKFPLANFIICGRGKLQAELEMQARHLNLSGSLKFLGFRPDVPRLLRLMDVFVLSSLSEGLSLSILEAMAAARPVVVTDVGGNHEIVVEGETGFLVQPRNAKALAEKVCYLLGNDSVARRMGENGRTRAAAVFSREIMLRNYEHLYEALVHNGRVKQ